MSYRPLHFALAHAAISHFDRDTAMPEPTGSAIAGGSPANNPVLLVNSGAGRRGKPNLQKLLAVFRSAGGEIDAIAVAPRELTSRVESLVRAGGECVAVGGGDGTLSSAARLIAGTGLALLPVPLGTLNTFSNRIGISSVDDAARALVDPRVQSIPIGIVDDATFLNTATFGLYADLVRMRDRLKPYLTKWPAALIAFAAILTRWRTFELAARVEDTELRRTTALLWIGMGWNSFPRVTAEPGAVPADLEIVVLRPRTRWGSLGLLFRLMRHLIRGRHPAEDPALEVLHARYCVIEAPRSIGVTLDGEPGRLRAPIFVGVQEGALRVYLGAYGGQGE